ncbi:MAG: hypothetical protein H7Y33_18400 [Cytophagales bacterium]|nr:hypothetical protein [Rhizobacter sp.]
MIDLPRFQSQVQAVGRMLTSIGYDANDFEIKADNASPLAQLFRLAGGLLVLRRRSTGEERFYATDQASGWADTLMNDLAHGALANPSDKPSQRVVIN